MAKVYVFLANGFEEVEALIPIDVLRRGGVDVVTVSIMGNSKTVTAAHNVQTSAMPTYSFCQAACPVPLTSMNTKVYAKP